MVDCIRYTLMELTQFASLSPNNKLIVCDKYNSTITREVSVVYYRYYIYNIYIYMYYIYRSVSGIL